MMKSFKALSWVALVNVSLLVACGGVSKTEGTSGASGNTGNIPGNAQGGAKPGTTGAGGARRVSSSCF